MEAVEKHVLPVAREWYKLKGGTCFAKLQAEWSVPLLATFLQESLDRPERYVAIELNNNRITAACGVSLATTLSPPHIPIVTEWMWLGKGKPAARVWAECKQWGKSNGAVLAHCSIGKSSLNANKFLEQSQWRVL